MHHVSQDVLDVRPDVRAVLQPVVHHVPAVVVITVQQHAVLAVLHHREVVVQLLLTTVVAAHNVPVHVVADVYPTV